MQFCLEESLNGLLKIQFYIHTVSSLNMHVCPIITHPSSQCLLSAPTPGAIIIYGPSSSSKI